jgi:cysteine desulfurase
MRRVYLDHNATTPTRPEVVSEMAPFFGEVFGNPSSLHNEGRKAKKALERARQRVADLISADPAEVVFTSGGTESDNHAIVGAMEVSGDRNHVVASGIEHQAVMETCKRLEKSGYEVSWVGVDAQGCVDARKVSEAITDRTALVSVMLANNDVGTTQPVREIARIAKAKGSLMHTDAVQAAGKIPVDVGNLGVDLLSLSSHKMYGPKGAGVLFIARGTRIGPVITGGHQERRRRAGTENLAAIAGFGKACELAAAELNTEPPRLRSLRDRLERGIAERITGAQVNGHPELRLPTTSNVSFDGLEGDTLLMNLDLMGIAVSTGSACSSGTAEPSHVLTAMGLTYHQAHGAIRFSLGRQNTEEDIDYVLERLAEIVERLRSGQVATAT